ncbi:DUF1549 domain-containing protein [Planctomicrobium piriforme]|uniref:DUF1549 domain-containing protein n=1 Tax=Planctomicrobium piriforme TaxID=1576369 RepID=A0A1I3CJ65_9PLAN|nr:DUF1549 domain-containing protein [Planctomicrobium piriforme]SFH74309.1 Protein of unknown function [Planctomicrobium piriforme]
MRKHVGRLNFLPLLGFSSVICLFVGVCCTQLIAADAFLADPISSGESLPQNSQPELSTWLNERFRQIWTSQQLQPVLCDDATYLRRVSLDLIGRIPSVGEIREFEADPSPEKRARLVEKLLSDPQDSAKVSPLASEHLARAWRRVLLPPDSTGAAAGPQFEPWLRSHFAKNTPYDQIVKGLVTARGEGSRDEQVFYAAIGATPEAEATEFSRIFLGVRIGCAQCHDHPFAPWKKQDFWGMAAFFNGLKFGDNMVVDNRVTRVGNLNDDDATGSIVHEGKTYAAKVLWADQPIALSKDRRPRDLLAEWMTSKEHPTFAANAANRVWQALMGRGLVEAVDDLDLASADDRALAEDLGRQFAAADFNLRWLISGICRSEAYQCDSRASDGDVVGVESGRRSLKALSPEQMFASLEQSLLLPVSTSNQDAARHNGEMGQLVQRLDESIGRSPEEYTAGIPQTLLLMNGNMLARATDLERSHTLRGVVEAPFLSDDERIELLYLATLSRTPERQEQARLVAYVERHTEEQKRKAAFGDILWALVNSPEFALCR